MVPRHDRIANCAHCGSDHVPLIRPHSWTNVVSSFRSLRRHWRRGAAAWLQRLTLDDQIREGFLGWIAGVGIKLFFLYLLVGVGMTITAGWNAALTGWTVADPTLPLTIAGGALIFMLLAWTIPNTAASVVGGAVSLNLSHAFEAAMAGYGLGRILTSQNAAGAESGAASQSGNSLGASLEAGDRAATNGARAASTHPTVQMPSSRTSAPFSPAGTRTATVGRSSATQLPKHSAQTSLL